LIIERIGSTKDVLGEAVQWDAESGTLWWIDAVGGVLRRFEPGSGDLQSWQVDPPIGALLLTRSDRIMLILPSGTYYFDPTTGGLSEHSLSPDALNPRVRLNDAKVDRRGRMVLGSLSLDYKANPNYCGKFYTLGRDRTLHAFDDGVGVANGPCFSPAGETLYIADSVRRTIWAYDYDQARGEPSGKRVFAGEDVLHGMPDGGTVDAEGHVWFTIMDRGALVRISPDGTLADEVGLPFNPTSIAFGGDGMATAFVTSLSRSANIEVTAPEAGGLFAISGLGVRGIAEVRFDDQ
jgi:L-arabinonolactonase